MSALHHSLFGKPQKIKANFTTIYDGLRHLFLAAGYAATYGAFKLPSHDGITVYDFSPKPGFSLESMVASMSLMVGEVWGVELAQFPVKGQKAVGLLLRIPKKKRKA
jgi:hypothetical protein